MCRGSAAGAGAWEECTAGSGIVFSGTQVQASGGGGGGSGGTALIATKKYAPATNTVFSTTSATYAVLDTTNLRVTFTGPASGSVIVKLTAYADYNLSTLEYGWALLSGASIVSSSGGIANRIATQGTGTTISQSFLITGLTSGTSYNWDWAHAENSTGTGRTLCGPGATSTTYQTNNIGTCLMEVWDGVTTSGGSLADPGQFNARLTTETGVPVSTTDRTAQSTIYLTPCRYGGNTCAAVSSSKIDLWDGSVSRRYTLTEISLALSALTTDSNYNWYVSAPGGVCCTLTLGAIWTNNTTPSETLATEDGYLVLSSDHQKRYGGVIRTTGAATTEDSGGITGTTQVGGKRFVWNYYNQVLRQSSVIDTTSTWTYSTTTIRQANAASGNKVEWVVGDAAAPVEVLLVSSSEAVNQATAGATSGIGIDSITVFSGLRGVSRGAGATANGGQGGASFSGTPGLGYHYAAWLERGGGGTTVWIGSRDSAQSGLTATIWN
jgi:hypothetical protein